MSRFALVVLASVVACGRPSASAPSGAAHADSKLEIELHDQGKREVAGPAFARYHEDKKTLEIFVVGADADPPPSCDSLDAQNPASPPKKLSLVSLAAGSFAGKPGAYEVTSSTVINIGGAGGVEMLADTLSATKIAVSAFDGKTFSAEITTTADEGAQRAHGTAAGEVCTSRAAEAPKAEADAPATTPTPPAPEPPAPPPPPHPSQPAGASVESVEALVCFPPGAATLDAKGVEQVKSLAKLLTDRMHRNPQVVRVAIDGRASPDENAKDPAKLSAARAQVVAARLAKSGVPKGKLVAHGRGASASYYAGPPFTWLKPGDEKGPCVDAIAFVSP